MCQQCANVSPSLHPRLSRRRFLSLASTGALGLGLLGVGLGTRSLFASPAGAPPKPGNVMTPDAAWQRLREGNLRYTQGASRKLDFATDRHALTGGQNPFAAILSCADSRVTPEFAFDTGLGDLFVVRVAGNVVDDDAVASFEYAFEHLGTPLLVVLGHEKCGAVGAAVKAVKERAEMPGHLPHLLSHIRPAVSNVLDKPGDLVANAVRENVLLNIENLKKATPILSHLVEEKKIRIVGGVYKLENGEVEWVS